MMTMTIDEAIAVLQAMNMESRVASSAEQREAIQTLGVAGWRGDLEPSDPRIAALPSDLARSVENIVAVMQKKRVIQ